MPSSLYMVIMWICAVAVPVALAQPTQYGDCIKFSATDIVPKVTDVEMICVKDTFNCSYCMFYPKSCSEPTACGHFPPIPTPDGRCLVCPGEECVYNGNAYHVGEDFPCLDDVNVCICNADGRVSHGKNPLPPPHIFCSV